MWIRGTVLCMWQLTGLFSSLRSSSDQFYLSFVTSGRPMGMSPSTPACLAECQRRHHDALRSMNFAGITSGDPVTKITRRRGLRVIYKIDGWILWIPREIIKPFLWP